MKTVKFQIAKPLTCDWKMFSSALFDIQYKNAKVMNYCMTQYYLYQEQQEAFRFANGRYPTKDELPEPKVYNQARLIYPTVLSSIIAQSTYLAEKKWKQDRKACFYAQDKSLPTYRKTFPIAIPNQAWHIRRSETGTYELAFSLHSTEAKICGKRSGKEFVVELVTNKANKSFMAVINRIVSGEYKKSMIKILRHPKKPKWFVLFSYEPAPQTVVLSDHKVLGIDLGISNAFWATTSDGAYINADGMEIVKFRSSIRQRRKSIQNQGQYSGRGGHGRKRMLLPTMLISDKERRFRDARYHLYSKRIVDFAIKNGCGIIQMEDLTSLKNPLHTDDPSLCALIADWAVCDLRDKIKLKAEDAGIKVVEVNPAYTSLRCSKCGFISKANRPEVSVFRCEMCGFEAHADHNASINLAVPAIDQIIAEQIASGGVMFGTGIPLERNAA